MIFTKDYWLEIQWENTELLERLSEAAEVMAETGRIADTPAAKRAWVEGKPADPKGHWTR